MDDAVKALIATPLTKHSLNGPVTRMPLVAPAIAIVLGIAAGLLAPMNTGFWLVLGAAGLLPPAGQGNPVTPEAELVTGQFRQFPCMTPRSVGQE